MREGEKVCMRMKAELPDRIARAMAQFRLPAKETETQDS